MSAAAIRAGAAYVELGTKNEIETGLNKARASLKKFGSDCVSVGRDMFMYSAAAATPFLLAAKTFMDFDDKMRMVKGVTGATGKEFDSLTEKAKKLGRETSFTASQVGEGMTALGRMGFNPKEIEAAIPSVMDLSKATGTELGEAATIASNNMRVFRMDASKMADVADILTVTANGSAQTLVDLGESLKMAGPVARMAGEDLKGTAANLGILANMGLRGSLAGTALSKSYRQMANPKVQEFLRQYNVETVDTTGKLRKMRDILADMAKVMNAMPNAQRIAFAEEVFDARGMLGGGVLAGNVGGIDNFMKLLDNAKGAAKRTAEEMEGGLGGSFRRFLSMVEGLAIAVGEALAPRLISLSETLTSVISGVVSFVNQNRELISTIAVIAPIYAGIGVSLMALGAAIKIVSYHYAFLAKVIHGVSAAQKFLFGAGAAEKALMAEKSAIAAEAKAREQAEQMKLLSAKKSAAIREAVENRRHYNELSNASKEAQAVLATERTKLAALQARYNVEAANNSKAMFQYVLKTGSRAGFQNTPEFTAASADLSAQQKRVAGLEAHTAALGRNTAAAKANTIASIDRAKGAAAAETSYAASVAASAAADKSHLLVTRAKVVASHQYLALLGLQATRMNVVAALVWQTSLAEITAGAKVAATSKLAVAGLVAKGVAAKVASGAFLGLSAAMGLVVAHPIIAALAVIAGALGYMIWQSNAATAEIEKNMERVSKASDEASEKRSKGDELRSNADLYFERLSQLEEISKKGKLTSAQIREAQDLMKKMKPFGSDMWGSLDVAAGKFTKLADSIKLVNDRVKEMALAELNKELKAKEEKRVLLNEKKDNIANKFQLGFSQNWFGAGQAIGKFYESIGLPNNFKVIENAGNARSKEMEQANAEIYENENSIIDIKNRRKALLAGDKNALSGKGKTGTTQENVDDYNNKKIITQKEYEDAVEATERLEDQIARKRMNSLEQEIHDIKKRTEEYKKALTIQLEYEKNKTVGKRDEKKIAELEAKLAQADKDQKTDIKKAETDESDKFKKTQRKESDRLSDFEKGRASQNEKETTDRKIDQEFKKSKDEGIAYLEKVFQNSMSAAASALSDYQNTVKKADADGKRIDEEKEDIDNKFSEYQRRIGTADDYRRRLEDARAGTAGSMEKIDVAGSFFVNQIQTVKGAGSIGEKQLSVQEKIAKNTDETTREVKKIKTGVVTTA